MATENTASGPATGNAGEVGAGLDKAFDAAFTSLGIDDGAFHAAAEPVADDPKPQQEEQETPSPEDAAPAKPEGQKPPVDKTAKPKPAQNAPAEPAPSTMAAPAHWDAAKREAFGKLPPEAQKVVTDLSRDLEAGFTRRSQELADKTRYAESVRSLIKDDHRAQLRQAGLNEVQGIERLIQLNDFATNNAPDYVRWVVQATGLDPRQLFPELSGGQPQPGTGQQQPAPTPQSGFQIPPQLLDTIRALEGKVTGFERERATTQQRSAAQVIARFRSETDAAGNPAYPFFEQAKDSIVEQLHSPALLQIEDYGERLKRAYEIAVYSNPELRNQIVDSEAEKRVASKRQADDVARAKRARAPISSAQPTTTGQVKPKTLDDALSQAGSSLGMNR